MCNARSKFVRPATALTLCLGLLSLMPLSAAAQLAPECAQVMINRSGGVELDFFGTAVEIDDTSVFVGMDPFDNIAIGKVHVLRPNPGVTAWLPVQVLEATFEFAEADFGASLARDGDILVVGAPRDHGLVAGTGSAWVFRFNPVTDQWDAEAELFASDGNTGDAFGLSVAVSGDAILVGSPLDNISGCVSSPGTCQGVGSAYLFRHDGANWVEEMKLNASDGDEFDQFGMDVALNGAIAIIGAWVDDNPNGADAGAVYAYRKFAGNWLSHGKVLAPDGAAGDNFGRSVEFNGLSLVVGAPEHDYGGADAGVVYVFDNDGTSAWPFDTTLTPPLLPVGPNDRFGIDLDLDGPRLVVATGRFSFGSALAYEQRTGVWEFESRLIPFGETGFNDGIAVAVHGNRAIVGDRWQEFVGVCCIGAAFTFSGLFEPDCNANCINDLDEIAAGTELDCNDNGLPDSCDLAAFTSLDCDNNLVPDECEDCNGNGLADACELAGDFSVDSPQLAPVGLGFPVMHTFIAPPEAMSDVALDCSAVADLGGITKSLDVFLNGELRGNVFKTSGTTSCPLVAETSQLIIPMAIYNALVGAGDATFTFQTFDGVDSTSCGGSPWVAFTMSYIGPPSTPDVNANGVPDECDIARGDSDLDGTVGINDFLAVLARWGPCPASCPWDANGDGIVGILEFLNVLANWG